MSGINKIPILAGTTSLRIPIWVRDSSVNYDKGLTGLVYNSASLTAYYFRDNGVAGIFTPIAITLATATVGSYTSGGFKEIDGTNMPGYYELGVPNAAIATGSNRVIIMLKGATNMVQTVIELELLGNNPYSAAFSSDANSAIATALLATAIESGVTMQQILRAIGAATAGDYDDATQTFKGVGVATTRLTVTLSGGDRAVTESL